MLNGECAVVQVRPTDEDDDDEEEIYRKQNGPDLVITAQLPRLFYSPFIF